ncbi:hypothetical protein pqer_cds_147 [Pandoravirus quercus]|uniref:Uncharacterized protein n=1 Tax=Pandoravirus quercus TaxID=2107709 RepID=A0A2U7U816_9VIRU|nr:hypothetical protein pqer_cds_147 [Pandoravirus quercus]AVK74569.1 hypothetical protein pqer_cds_147 [Pandoravirus quercus]
MMKQRNLAETDDDLTTTMHNVAAATRACPWIHGMAATISTEIVPPPTAASVAMWLVLSDPAVRSDAEPATITPSADVDGVNDGDRKSTTLRLIVDVCVPRAAGAVVEAAATKIDMLVPGAARTKQSAHVRNDVVDFGVYKRDGFDDALGAVRGLPGMADISAREVAQRGASRASNHPRDMYNLRFVDVVPRSEAVGRDGLIATHRGIDTTTQPDGLWAKLCIEVGECDARLQGAEIIAIIAALVRAVEPGSDTVPSSRNVTWMPLYP